MWLLVAAVPWQAGAVSTMAMGAGSPVSATATARAAMPMAMAMALGPATTAMHVQSVAAPDAMPPCHGTASAKADTAAATHGCAVCAACGALAVPPFVARVAPVVASHRVDDTVPLADADFLTEGPLRPPRAVAR